MNVYYPRAQQKRRTHRPIWDVLLYNLILWMEAQKPLLKNKLYALGLFVVGALSVCIDGDATAFVLILMLFVIPLLFAKENWII